ncbi:hypothetical protein HYW73_02665 [Candidatus Nomurabacteria bacterium]|nr:hypothetical protein [Candidatus Nomurabacteria bacterium]
MIFWIEAIGVTLISYWVSRKFPSITFPMAAIGILGVWFFATKGRGFLQHLIGVGGGAVGHGPRHFFGSIGHFFLNLSVWVAVMMIGARVTGVSNSYAFYHLDDLGWRFWYWPSGIAMDLLMWVSIAFLAGWVATQAGRGNMRVAGTIFAVTAIVIGLIMVLPTTGKRVLPTEKTGPQKGEVTKNATDTALAEAYSKGGVVGTGGAVVATVLSGSTTTDIENDGWIGSPLKRIWRGAFGKRKDPPPTAPHTRTSRVREHTTVAPASEPPIKVRGTTPTEVTANYGFSLEADAPIMVQYPGEDAFLFNPSATGDCQQLPQPRRSGPKKFWDPNDPENGKVSFRIYRGGGHC